MNKNFCVLGRSLQIYQILFEFMKGKKNYYDRFHERMVFGFA